MRLAILILLLSLSFASLAQKTDVETMGLKGKVKRFTEWHSDTTKYPDHVVYNRSEIVRNYNEKGMSIAHRDSSIRYTVRKERTERVVTSAANVTFEYDDNGRIQRAVTIEYSASPIFEDNEWEHYITRYIYDANGREIMSVESPVDKPNDTLRVYSRNYDADGRIADYTIYFRSRAKPSYKERYLYDAQGR